MRAYPIGKLGRWRAIQLVSSEDQGLSYWLAGKMRSYPIGRFRQDGFYSVNVGTDLKIIAINSNMCLTYNFYLFLQWEVETYFIISILVVYRLCNKFYYLS